MAKKKLLSEAQVRRFMGLAGMQANTVSNVITEMYSEQDEDPADAEPEMGAAPEAPDAPEMGAEEPEMGGDEMDDADMGDADATLDPDAIQNLRDAFEAVMNPLEDQMGDEEPMGDSPEMDDEEPADLGGEEPEAMDAPADDEEDDAELSEVDLQLSEEEIVNEVARRVANRILKAKRAKKALDEALGRK